MEFIQQLNETSSGLASFEVIPREQWTFPEWINADTATSAFEEQERQGIPHGGSEGYHHMCRFFSGYVPIYDKLPPLQDCVGVVIRGKLIDNGAGSSISWRP